MENNTSQMWHLGCKIHSGSRSNALPKEDNFARRNALLQQPIIAEPDICERADDAWGAGTSPITAVIIGEHITLQVSGQLIAEEEDSSQVNGIAMAEQHCKGAWFLVWQPSGTDCSSTAAAPAACFDVLQGEHLALAVHDAFASTSVQQVENSAVDAWQASIEGDATETHGVAQRKRSLFGSLSDGLISYIGGSGGKKASLDATESTMRFIFLGQRQQAVRGGVVPRQSRVTSSEQSWHNASGAIYTRLEPSKPGGQHPTDCV